MEIAKALVRDSRILIMDEPTAALTPPDVEKLFAIIGGLKAEGVAIIYISHRIEEIFEVAERVTVLRDGETVAANEVGAIDHGWVISHMVGRSLDQLYPRTSESQARSSWRSATDTLRRLSGRELRGP